MMLWPFSEHFSCCHSQLTDDDKPVESFGALILSEGPIRYPGQEEEEITLGLSSATASQAPAEEGLRAPLASEAKPEVPAMEKAEDAKKAVPLSDAERETSRSFLYDFAKTALAGVPCTSIRRQGEHFKRTSSSYSLDRALKQLIVREAGNSGSKPMATCPLEQIKDVYSLVADGASSFPAPVLAYIHPEERDRLIMLVRDSKQDERQCIFLVLESVESRDTFLEGLRMLCMSAKVEFLTRAAPP
jgi:hypothetical protein